MTNVLLIIGVRPDGTYSAIWSNYADQGTGLEPHPTLSPDGGGTSPPPAHEFPHEATCDNEDGAAAQIAETIMATDDTGPNLFDWTAAEYGAIIDRRSNSDSGAYGNLIYSEGQPNFVRLPSPDSSANILGLIHNHPGHDRSETQRKSDRYPSIYSDGRGDWDGLSRIYERYRSLVPNYDPSMWVIDSLGVTRRFRYSERAYFESLSDEAMENGVGLDDREAENDC